jgi:hypothetical protein
MLTSLRTVIAEMPVWFRRTTAGAAMVAETRADEEQRRRAAIDEIAAARAAHEARIPSLNVNVGKEQAAVAKLDVLLAAANRRLATVTAARRSSVFEVTAAERRHAAMFRDTAPTCLATFIDDLNRTMADIRTAGVDTRVERATATRPRMGGQVQMVTYSNYEGQVAVLQAIRAAIGIARDLHVHVATEAEAEDAIARLRAGLRLERLKEMTMSVTGATIGDDGPRAA